MDFFQRVRDLQLPEGQFVVVGGSVLVALGLIDWDDDVDICVAPELFEKFKREGWAQADWQGKTVLKHDVYDVGVSFGKWTLEQLLQDAQIIQGIPFMNLAKLKAWKTATGRPKDLRHLALIDQYNKTIL